MLIQNSTFVRASWREWTMNVLICDDDPLTIEQIKRELNTYCLETEPITNLFTFSCAKDIPSLEQYDIAFLDLDMNDMNGIELARNLRKVRPDAVIIFVTNFIQYAPEGYEVQAFRYLLKKDLHTKLINYFELAIQEFIKSRKIVTISINGEAIDIPVQNILFLESNRRLITMHLIATSRSSYEFYGNMANLTQKLGILGFLRVQKSFLVNMEYIELFQYGKLRLKTGQLLTTSEKNHAELKEQYLRWKGKNKWSIS